MDKRYQTYNDYFKTPFSAASRPTTTDRPPLSFNQAAYLAEKAMEAVKASMESKGDTGGTISVGPGYGGTGKDQQGGVYPPENIGMDHQRGHQQDVQRERSGVDLRWKSPAIESYNSAPSELQGQGMGDEMQREQNYCGTGRSEVQGLQGGRRNDRYGYDEQEYQGEEYGYSSGSGHGQEHYQDGSGYSDVGEQYLNRSQFHKRGDGHPPRGWHGPTRGSQRRGFNDPALRGRGQLGRSRGQQLSRGRGQQFSRGSRSNSGNFMPPEQAEDTDLRSFHGEGRGANHFKNRGTNRGPRRGPPTRGSNFTPRGRSNQYGGSSRRRGGGTQNRSGPDQHFVKRPNHLSGPVETNRSQTKGPTQPPSRRSNQPPSMEHNVPKTSNGADQVKAKGENSSLNKAAASEVNTEKAGPAPEVVYEQMQDADPVSGWPQKEAEDSPVGHQGTNPPDGRDKSGVKALHQQGKGSEQGSRSGCFDSVQPVQKKETAEKTADKLPSSHESSDSSEVKESTDPKASTSTAFGDVVEEEEDSEEDTSFCKLCNMSFDSADKFFRHTRGLLHTQRQMECDDKKSKSCTVPQPQASQLSPKKPLWQRNSSQGAPLPRVQAVLEPHFGTWQQQQQGLQKEQHAQGQEQELHGQQNVYEYDGNYKHEGQQQWGRREQPGGAGGIQQQLGRSGRRQQEFGSKGTDDWSAGQDGQQEWQDQHQGEEKHRQPQTFSRLASAGRGSFKQEAAAATVQRRPAAATSQGLALISGEGDQEEEEDWEEEEDEWEEEGVKEGEAKGGEPGEFHCALCDIVTTGAVSLRAHLNGRNHKMVQEAKDSGTSIPRRLITKLGPNAQVPENQRPPVSMKTKPGEGPSTLVELLKSIPEAIVGLKCVKELQLSRQPTFLCQICESQCDSASIQTHLMGSKHRMKYLREYHPDIYELVKSHGGKKSQLSAFLEEVCSDIEAKQGRGEPVLEQPEEDSNAEKKSEKISEKKLEENPPKVVEKEKKGHADTSSLTRQLPHEVVVARYKEDKRRKEMIEKGYELTEPGYRHDRQEPMEPSHARGREGPVERGYGRGREDPMEHGYGRGREGSMEYGYGRGREGPLEYGYGRGREGRMEYGYERGREGPIEYGYERGREGPSRAGPMEPGYGHGRDGPMEYGYGGSREYFERGRDRFMDPEFGPMDAGYGRPRDFPHRERFFEERRAAPYPPFRDPRPYLSEEERRRHMYEYERRNFVDPHMGVSPEEARHMMFAEYERLGISYELACQRVLIQEERQMRLIDYVREGMSLEDARQRIISQENRRQLVLEYERQGLAPREALWRVIVEEERARLFEDYERRGLTPFEARAQIMSGHDRMHLIHEFERHGIPPHEARCRAIAEEDRLRGREHSVSSTDGVLDDIADKRLLENYLEQGMTREEAENKVIANLRRQGVPIQEAIIRVQKIQVQAPQVRDRRSPSSDHNRDSIIQDQGKQDSLSRDRAEAEAGLDRLSHDRAEAEAGQDRLSHDRAEAETGQDRLSRDRAEGEAGPSKTESDYDDITPEEAKERLLREYEKRGVPREEARKALIDELVRSGVSPEEAKRRFSDSKSSAGSSQRGRDSKRERSQLKRPYTGYDHTRSRISSCSSDGSSSGDERSHQKLHRDDRRRGDRVHKSRTDSLSPRMEKHRHPPYRDERDRCQRRDAAQARGESGHQQREEQRGRPALTLGEELRLKKEKRGYPDHQEEIPAKHAKHASDAKKTASSQPSDKAAAAGQSDSNKGGDVAGLLESLTNNLISSEDDAAMALQVSKALTSALLKYRLKSVPGDKEGPSQVQSRSSFVERRIEDAKKLFESKIQMSKEQSLSSSQVSQTYRSKSGHSSTEMSEAVQAKCFGLSPSLPAQAPPPQPSPPRSQPEITLGSIPIPPGRPPREQRPSYSHQQQRGSPQSHFQEDIFADEDAKGGAFGSSGKGRAGTGKKSAVLPRVLYTKNHPTRSDT